MKSSSPTVTLLTITIVSIGLMASLLAQLSTVVQAAPMNELDVCPTCTYTTIQTAVDAANPGDTIRVVAGTYQDIITISGFYTTTILIAKSINLLGGFSPDFQTHDPTIYETIIDGQNIAQGIYILAGNVHIEGFTITNSNNQGIDIIGDYTQQITLTNNYIHDNITGIVIYSVGATISNNRITNNSGVGIVIFEASAMVTSNTIAQNRKGIFTSDSLVTIEGNQILSNTSVSGAGMQLASNTQFTVTHNIIKGNLAETFIGGGIQVLNTASGIIAYNQIVNNTAEIGGGIGTYFNDELTISHNDIHLNTARQDGGGIYIFNFGGEQPLIIDYNSIYTNTAENGAGLNIVGADAAVIIDSNDIRFNHTTGSDDSAGGINIEQTSIVTMVNNVVAHNDNRGVTGVNYTEIELINNTIVGNGTTALEMYGWPITTSVPMTTTLVNNIIANHSECALIGLNGAVFAAHYNDVFGHALDGCGATIFDQSNNLNTNPLFVNEANGNYHLTTNSPAIDSGTSLTAPLTDIEGNTRPQDKGIDMGAYEGRHDAQLMQIFLPVIFKVQ